MDHTFNKMEDHTLIEITGKIDGRTVVSAGSFIRKLKIEYPETVILDVNGLEDENEMFYHVALINSFKKEVEQAGGTFKIRSAGLMLGKYLNMTGLNKLFLFDEPALQSETEA